MSTTVTLTNKQQHAYNTVVYRRKNVLIPACAGSGKEQPVSEPVLTPNGWSTMGQLNVGDCVIGSNGNPTMVLQVYPQGLKDVYTITFEDGSKVRCGENHLWSLEQNQDSIPVIVDTLTLINSYLKADNKKLRYKYSVKAFAGVQNGLIIENAYALGYILGSGCLTKDILTVSSHLNKLSEVVDTLDYSFSSLTKVKLMDLLSCQVRYLWREVYPELQKYEAKDDAQSKNPLLEHIYYLWNYHSRLELLKGLVDSDCNLGELIDASCKTKTYTFTSNSEPLINLTQDLIRSLGRICCEPTVKKCHSKYKSEYVASLKFKMPANFLKITEGESALYSTNCSIINVVKENYQEESVCIKVNAHDSLYVTSGYKLTHNTTLVIEIQKALVKEGYTILNTSFTAKSASLLPGGSTIGRIAGMRRGVDDVLPEGIKEDRMWNGVKRTNINQVIHKADKRINTPLLAIVIDEISQLSSENLYLFYNIVMKSRQLHQVHQTPPIFIVVGDFGQFASISGNLAFKPASFEYWKTNTEKAIVTYPTSIDSIDPEVIILDEVVRQTDAKYIRALKWCYYGIAVHPTLLARFDVETPVGTSRTYFNNREVVTENIRHLERFLEKNPDSLCRTYIAASSTLSESETKQLSPVTSQMTIFIGFPFSVTINVVDPADKKTLLVTNGELVTVIALGPKSIEVVKSDGRTVTLSYVQHRLPVDANGHSNTFLQLPGYPGSSTSLYKFQGETCTIPMEFAAWQWRGDQRISLKEQAGSIYVMCSRNTQLEDLYFDTSFGIDKAKRLFREAISVNPETLNYLLKGKPPLWKTDSNKKFVVVELEKCTTEIINGYTFYTFWYTTTFIKSGKEILYCLRYYNNGGTFKLINAADLSEDTLISIDLNDILYLTFYTDLAEIWVTHYSDL